jgi:tRNA 2-thiouridine synthesizing protein C
MQKNLLFISRHAPYGSSIAREALDALLATSAYGQALSLLFMDDGVFQLLLNQDSREIGQKNFASMLPVLPLYEVENIFVHLESLQVRGMSQKDLLLDNVQIIDSQAVSDLLRQQDQLLSF